MTESTLGVGLGPGAESSHADAVVQAAERLMTAFETGVPCAPIRDLIGATDITLAYAVQQLFNQARVEAGVPIVGRKAGLTSTAVQRQLGVGQPDLGVLFADMVYGEGTAVPLGRLLQPKVEAEIAFVLGADLAEGDLELDQVEDAVDHALAAIEICDSRIAGWDIRFTDTVADNASSGAYVLGTDPRPLADFRPREVEMHMRVTDQEDSHGTGVDCLGDPLVAVQWLARQARALGEPLRAGQVILSGALGPMRPAAPGAHVEVTITGFAPVSVSFSEEVSA